MFLKKISKIIDDFAVETYDNNEKFAIKVKYDISLIMKEINLNL